jgi:hypothetical protein
MPFMNTTLAMPEGVCRTLSERESTTIGHGNYDRAWAVSACGCDWQTGVADAAGIVVDDDRIAANPINHRDWTGLATVGDAGWTGGMVRPAPRLTPIELYYEFADEGGLVGWSSWLKQSITGWTFVRDIDAAISDMERRLYKNGCKVHNISHIVLSGHGAPLLLGPMGGDEVDLNVQSFSGPARDPRVTKLLNKIGENLAPNAKISLVGCRVGEGESGKAVVQGLVRYFKDGFGVNVTVLATVPSVEIGWTGVNDENSGWTPEWLVADENGVRYVEPPKNSAPAGSGVTYPL